MCKGKKLCFCMMAIFCVQMVWSQTTKPLVTAAAQANQKQEVPFSGTYSLYSGVPTVYIGTLVVMKDGKYKVAFGTDENAFETGSYQYDATEGTIHWVTGLFQRNKWKGKLTRKPGGYRIAFNKITFAETN